MGKENLVPLPKAKPRVLIVEDDELFRLSLVRKLGQSAHCSQASSNREANALLDRQTYDIAFFDLQLGHEYVDFNLIQKAALEKGIYSVVLTSHDDNQLIDKAYEYGCHDYFIKNADLTGITKIIEKFSGQKNEERFKEFIDQRYITQDQDTIEQLRSLLLESSGNSRPVFIEGPSGVGKSLLAQAAHDFLIGDKGQFVHLNCKGLSETLLESELFGHEKGAFTDAKEKKIGKLKLADNGTLFLDEVATMPMPLQAALLVVIEKKQFMPVGGNKLVQSNFRLICATNENMIKLVREGTFREDLFYRIYKNVITLKPLKDRRGDIPLIIDHFRNKSSARRIVIRPQAMEVLKRYQYPANVRDVEDIVDILLKSASGRINVEDLPQFVVQNENRYLKGVKTSAISEEILREVRTRGLLNYLEDHKKSIIGKFIELNSGVAKDAMKEMRYFSNRIYGKSEPKNRPERKLQDSGTTAQELFQ